MPSCQRASSRCFSRLSSSCAGAAAHAADLKDALARFTTDDFSETAEGISEVAATGDPRAATIIEALQTGRLFFSAEQKAVYYKDAAGQAVRCRHRQPVATRAGRSRNGPTSTTGCAARSTPRSAA